MSRPTLFTAYGGSVLFRGRPLSESTAAVVVCELRARGISALIRRDQLIWCRYFAEAHAAQRDAMIQRCNMALRARFISCAILAIVIAGGLVPVPAGAQDRSLATINSQVNRAHRYGEPTQLGIDGVYDCEDYAWEKYRLIVGMGAYPREALRVVTLRSPRFIHAVLVVNTPSGLVVLDNEKSRLASPVEYERRGLVPVWGWFPQ